MFYVLDANRIVPDENSGQNENELARNGSVDGKRKKSSKPPKPPKKHRSVLQIKLGKLALQIGYGGNN